MNDSKTTSISTTVVGILMLVVGLAVFAVRLTHDGPYAVPRGGNLFGGLGALALGSALLWSGLPRAFSWAALASSPVVLFFALYATMAELEEVVSLYATDSEGKPAELRLWIIDREDGAWAGMPRAKAIEHSLDGARIDLLRNGETLCVVPALHEDRPTVEAVHAQKMAKYAVARASAAIGVYSSTARDTTVAVRFDLCPE